MKGLILIVCIVVFSMAGFSCSKRSAEKTVETPTEESTDEEF